MEGEAAHACRQELHEKSADARLTCALATGLLQNHCKQVCHHLGSPIPLLGTVPVKVGRTGSMVLCWLAGASLPALLASTKGAASSLSHPGQKVSQAGQAHTVPGPEQPPSALHLASGTLHAWPHAISTWRALCWLPGSGVLGAFGHCTWNSFCDVEHPSWWGGRGGFGQVFAGGQDGAPPWPEDCVLVRDQTTIVSKNIPPPFM